jgi:hypothetical protein
MKRILVGVAVLGLAQAAGIYAANADGVRLVTGTVNANGTSQTPTNTFTIAHTNGTGRYVITFASQVFGRQIPACIV